MPTRAYGHYALPPGQPGISVGDRAAHQRARGRPTPRWNATLHDDMSLSSRQELTLNDDDAMYTRRRRPSFPLDREVRPIHTGNVARYDRDVLMLVFFAIFGFASKQGAL